MTDIAHGVVGVIIVLVEPARTCQSEGEGEGMAGGGGGATGNRYVYS